MITFDKHMAESEYRDGSHFGIHALMDYARMGPKYFYQRHVLRSLVEESDNRDAMDFGKAAHAYILEGEASFEAACAVRPDTYTDAKGAVKPWHGSSNTCKEWKAAQEAAGRTIIAGADFHRLVAMYDAVYDDQQASEWLREGFAESVFRTNIHGVPLQCRPDWIIGRADDPASWQGIVDLKTCRNLNAFEGTAWRAGYWWQAAFYLWMVNSYRKSCGIDVSRELPFFLIAVEKEGVHRVKCARIAESAIMLADGGDLGWQATLAKLTENWLRNQWPTGVRPGVYELFAPEYIERLRGALP